MKRTLLLLTLLGVVAAIAPMASANHSAGWHWRRGSNPFDVRVINGTTSGWFDSVNGAARRWSNKSTVLDMDTEDGGSGCGAVVGAVKVCNGYFSGSWAGLTTVTLIGKHIQSAVVQLDNSALSASRAVACHELGHSIGLAHRTQSETTSCMTPSISSAQTRPDSHDLRMLKRIYRHGDGIAASSGDVRVVRMFTYLSG
jgi:hypothetical protein